MPLVLIDGYNAIHKIRDLAHLLDKQGLQAAREGLGRVVAQWKARVAWRGEVCIVFDGSEKVSMPSIDRVAGIGCVYTTHGYSADQYIIDTLKHAAQGERCLVISDDNCVCNHCKAFGFDAQRVSVLVGKEIKKSTRSRGHLSKHVPEKQLNPQARDSINADMKRIWKVD